MRLITVVKTGFALLIAAILASFGWDYFSGWTKQGHGGIVIIDSPEVYSRERLINDRFRQVAWLEGELEEAKNKNFGNQAIADLRSIWNLDAEANVGDAEVRSGGAQIQQAEDKPKPGELTVSPSERFSDMLAYREEIRTEMMETLLDDRHDIKGNTLYRLKLDTTVLPEENTGKLVVIQARLRKAKFCEENGQSSASHPCISIDSIHRNWMQLTETKLNVGVDALVDLIRSKNLPTDSYDKISAFLLSKINDIDADGVDWRHNKWVDAYYRGVKRWENTRIVAPTSNCEQFTGPNAPPPEPQCIIQAYEFYYRTANPRYNHRYAELRKLLFAYYRDNLDSTFQYELFFRSQVRSCDESLQGLAGCNRVFVDCDYCNPRDLQEARDRIARIRSEKIDYTEARNAELALLRFAIVAYTIDRYTYSNEERAQSCKKLIMNNGSNFTDKALSCLAHIEKTNCKVEACAITVTRLPQARKTQMACEGNGESDADIGVYCDLRENFKRLLSDRENIYSYAITPKESVQRVLSIESERRQKQLAMSLVARLSTGELNAKAVEGLTRFFSEDSAYSEQVKRKPLVVSFGRGQPRTTAAEDESCKGEDCAFERSATDFGWILGPKYLNFDKRGAEPRFVQVPAQHSLSAVVSVPSWWTAIDIDIESCWIDQSDIRDQQSRKIDNFCSDEVVANSHDSNIQYTVRLPGSPSELPRKFGYDIERAPWIERNQGEPYLADFYVGQRDVSLIIKGSELWRSTVVTIGNQKADRIEVLPNMKGIIAKFEEIKLPHHTFDAMQPGGGPPECFVRSEVIVWTSEGRTDPPHYVYIHPNPNSAANDETQLPQGFSGCDSYSMNMGIADQPLAEKVASGELTQ